MKVRIFFFQVNQLVITVAFNDPTRRNESIGNTMLITIRQITTTVKWYGRNF